MHLFYISIDTRDLLICMYAIDTFMLLMHVSYCMHVSYICMYSIYLLTLDTRDLLALEEHVRNGSTQGQ